MTKLKREQITTAIVLMISGLLLLEVIEEIRKTFNFLKQTHEHIEWQPWQARLYEQSQHSGQFIFIDISDNDDQECQKMFDQTYNNYLVINLLEDHFIPIRINAAEHPELIAHYAVEDYPTFIILDSNGSKVLEHRGYIPSLSMVWMLEAVMSEPGTSRSSPISAL